ncbi:MAG: hypothetical protein V1789_10730 [PVC group bacterium]
MVNWSRISSEMAFRLLDDRPPDREQAPARRKPGQGLAADSPT